MFGRTSKTPEVAAPTLSYCETAGASTYTPIHVRVVGPEGLKTGGGAPGAALCGRELRFGWDLRLVTVDQLRTDRVDPDPNWPGHTCRGCRDAALEMEA